MFDGERVLQMLRGVQSDQIRLKLEDFARQLKIKIVWNRLKVFEIGERWMGALEDTQRNKTLQDAQRWSKGVNDWTMIKAGLNRLKAKVKTINDAQWPLKEAEGGYSLLNTKNCQWLPMMVNGA